MYAITTDLERNRVTVEFDGPFDYDSDKFREDFLGAIAQVRSAGTAWDLLVDYLKAQVLSPDRYEKGEEYTSWMLANGLRKSASVVGGALQSLQLKRMKGRTEEFRHFASRREAEDWLAE